jgi:hypothetical protein
VPHHPLRVIRAMESVALSLMSQVGSNTDERDRLSGVTRVRTRRNRPSPDRPAQVPRSWPRTAGPVWASCSRFIPDAASHLGPHRQQETNPRPHPRDRCRIGNEVAGKRLPWGKLPCATTPIPGPSRSEVALIERMLSSLTRAAASRDDAFNRGTAEDLRGHMGQKPLRPKCTSTRCRSNPVSSA